MGKNNITIMIVSTIPDMFAEHYYFIKNVFPKLKEFCQDYDINLDYVDLFFQCLKTSSIIADQFVNILNLLIWIEHFHLFQRSEIGMHSELH